MESFVTFENDDQPSKEEGLKRLSSIVYADETSGKTIVNISSERPSPITWTEDDKPMSHRPATIGTKKLPELDPAFLLGYST